MNRERDLPFCTKRSEDVCKYLGQQESESSGNTNCQLVTWFMIALPEWMGSINRYRPRLRTAILAEIFTSETMLHRKGFCFSFVKLLFVISHGKHHSSRIIAAIRNQTKVTGSVTAYDNFTNVQLIPSTSLIWHSVTKIGKIWYQKTVYKPSTKMNAIIPLTLQLPMESCTGQYWGATWTSKISPVQ